MALKVGDPRESTTDIGPMIDKEKAEEAYRKVQEAEQQGARVLIGGELKETLFEPTVIVDTKPDMRVVLEEVFAPVISVIPYDDFPKHSGWPTRVSSVSRWEYSPRTSTGLCGHLERWKWGSYRERHSHLPGRPDAIRWYEGVRDRA